jgi:hypothetical protein
MKKLLLVALLLSLTGCLSEEQATAKSQTDACFALLAELHTVSDDYVETMQGYHALVKEQADALAEARAENIMLREIILENLPQEKKAKEQKEQKEYSMSMLGMEINTWEK